MKMPTAAFDQGITPTVMCLNKSKVPYKQWGAGPDFPSFIAALQAFADLFKQFWGVGCKLQVADALQAGSWGMVFTDNANVANALGYHDTTPDGMPLMHNFVQTTIMDGEQISVTGSHELAEALADPCINLCAVGPRGLIYGYEVCDAVEQQRFALNGMNMSDFQLPAWFEGYTRKKYDYLGKCTKPFQLLAGGYMPVMRGGQWSQIFFKEREKLVSPLRRRRVFKRGQPLIASSTQTWDPDYPGGPDQAA